MRKFIFVLALMLLATVDSNAQVWQQSGDRVLDSSNDELTATIYQLKTGELVGTIQITPGLSFVEAGDLDTRGTDRLPGLSGDIFTEWELTETNFAKKLVLADQELATLDMFLNTPETDFPGWVSGHVCTATAHFNFPAGQDATHIIGILHDQTIARKYAIDGTKRLFKSIDAILLSVTETIGISISRPYINIQKAVVDNRWKQTSVQVANGFIYHAGAKKMYVMFPWDEITQKAHILDPDIILMNGSYFKDTYISAAGRDANYEAAATIIYRPWDTQGGDDQSYPLIQLDLFGYLMNERNMDAPAISNVVIDDATLVLEIATKNAGGVEFDIEMWTVQEDWEPDGLTWRIMFEKGGSGDFEINNSTQTFIHSYTSANTAGSTDTIKDAGLVAYFQSLLDNRRDAYKKGILFIPTQRNDTDGNIAYHSSAAVAATPYVEIEMTYSTSGGLTAQDAAKIHNMIASVSNQVQEVVDEATAEINTQLVDVQIDLSDKIATSAEGILRSDIIQFGPVDPETINNASTRIGILGRSLHPYDGTFSIVVNRWSQDPSPVAPPVFGLFHDQASGISYASSTGTEQGITVAKHFAYFTVDAADATGAYVGTVIQKDATGNVLAHSNFSFTHGGPADVDETNLATKLDIINLSNAKLKARTAIASSTLTKVIDTATYPSIAEPSAQPGQIVAVESVTDGTFQVSIYDYHESGGYASAGLLFATPGWTLEQVAAAHGWDASVIISVTPSDWP